MATTFDKASLVMIPSGVKEDKLYSIKPTDGSGDFTFSRGSDIQATRVNSSGLIEKAKENLLLQSNSFDTTWTNTNSTDTGGQSGYDGTSNAWLLQSTIASGEAYLRQAISVSGSNTFSIYAKAGTSNFLAFYINATSGTDPLAYFNLSTGAVGSISATATASIVSVGSGWYRCSVAYNATISNIDVYVTTADGSFLSTTGDNIYIQDAQLNHGLIAQDYVETTTAAVVEGLTADLPRLDYSGGASCSSLLLEPSRTNIIDQSEYFGAWTFGSGITLTHNHATSPEGVQNATLLARTTSGNVQQTKNVTSGETYAISVFGHAGTSSIVNITATGTLTTSTTEFDLSDQSITTTTGSVVDADIEDYGNGWYRCWITQTAASTGSGFVRINTGDNVNILLYGAQLEAGSYPTSYIPTYGAAANRGRDITTKTSVSSLIGQTEGTIFAEVQSIPNNDTAFLAPTLSDGTLNNSLYILRYTSGGVEYVEIAVRSGGVLGVDQRVALSVADGDKFAFAYKQNDFVVYRNGTQILSDTSGNVSAMSNVYLGQNYNGSATTRGDFKQALLFKSRLTNAELAALTTI